MNTLIPNKDTMHFLANIQKEIVRLASETKKHYPLYPLFAFDFQAEQIEGCRILPPAAEENFLFFPVEITAGTERKLYKIIFARTADNSRSILPGLKDEIKNAFPRKERTFRTATVIQENNGWQIYNDKWTKLT